MMQDPLSSNPGELIQRLTLYAYGLFGCFPHPQAEPALRVSGMSPEDLAMNVLLRLYDPADTTVQWDAGRGPLLPYLKRVLWSDFVDLKRAALYRHTAAAPESFDQLAGPSESPESRAARLQDRERLLAHLAAEPELAALAAQQLSPDGWPGYTNQELAARLHTTVSEVENRKKRLLHRLLKLWRQQAAAPSELSRGHHVQP
jgi:DNA-directed RNA polymerase specialized sigma24 family protein